MLTHLTERMKMTTESWQKSTDKKTYVYQFDSDNLRYIKLKYHNYKWLMIYSYMDLTCAIHTIQWKEHPLFSLLIGHLYSVIEHNNPPWDSNYSHLKKIVEKLESFPFTIDAYWEKQNLNYYVLKDPLNKQSVEIYKESSVYKIDYKKFDPSARDIDDSFMGLCTLNIVVADYSLTNALKSFEERTKGTDLIHFDEIFDPAELEKLFD